jgi:hypothetical protein
MKKKNVSTESSSGSLTQAAIASCVADLGRHTVTVSGGVKPLSMQERKHMPRPRKDGASIAREIAQLATKYGVTGIVDVDGMLSAVTQAEQLAPLDKAAANFSVLVHDRAFAAESASWKSATTGYTVLKRMAKDNPDLARDLTGVAATLKHAKSGATAGSGTQAGSTATARAATPTPEPATAAPSAAQAAPPAK